MKLSSNPAILILIVPLGFLLQWAESKRKPKTVTRAKEAKT